MTEIQTAAWVSELPLPVFIKPPFVVVGGTNLLAEFFLRVGSTTSRGKLWIYSPFMESQALEMLKGFESTPHREIDLCVMTSDERNLAIAQSSFMGYPWRSAISEK